jgi:2-deoxy-D-gluconate 3-dehydrogenase
MNLFRLDGKVALVTGASRGIGQAMAIALAQAGADVAGAAQGDQADTQAAVEACGRRYRALRVDVSQLAALAPLVGDVVRELGGLDIVVNNAGIIRRGHAIDFSEADWDAVMDVNLKAAFFLAQAAARQFIAQGRGGKVINVASMLSFQGGVRVASYTAAKSGLMGLTKLLANEWAPHGIGVNAIAPGYIATDNTLVLRQDEKRNGEILARIPAGRWGRPDDLAGATVFLAAAASDYMHGHTLAVDGGWLAR